MRKKMLIGNWKMNKIRDEVLDFVFSVNSELPSIDDVSTVICAPYLYLRSLVKRQGENLRIGAQNSHYEDNGAYTGEVSTKMLSEIGSEYVIVGHSERRLYYNETSECCNKKIISVLKYNMIPILCIGENIEERDNNTYKKLIENQLTIAFKDLKEEEINKIIIAYEPIWAIGTGKVPKTTEVEEVALFIRNYLINKFSKETANSTHILYGGSVNLTNIKEFNDQKNVDGFLVGGASLNSKGFIDLANALKK